MSKNKNTVVIRNRTDYDKLAEAIVKAELKVDDELELKKAAEYEKLQEEWQTNLGLDKEKSGLINDFKVLKNIVFMKKEKAIALAANNALLKMILIGTYRVFEILIYLTAVISLAIAILIKANALTISFAIIMIFLGILIARIIRVARFEIDNITDKNYLTTLFAAVMSFIAIVVSTVAIVISMIYKG